MTKRSLDDLPTMRAPDDAFDFPRKPKAPAEPERRVPTFTIRLPLAAVVAAVVALKRRLIG